MYICQELKWDGENPRNVVIGRDERKIMQENEEEMLAALFLYE